jgi:DNA-binding IclR family transcriptional regulator
MSGNGGASYRVPAAVNVARIILLLSKHGDGMRMVAIAQALGMNVSTCHNVLRTLRDEGLLAFDDSRKTYRVGLALLAAVNNVIARGDKVSLVRPILQRLSEQLRMTAILGEPLERKAIRLLMSTAPASGLSVHPPGMEAVPILSGSMGRVAAAWMAMDDSEMRVLFDEAPHEPELTFEDFAAQVRAVRSRGWATDEGTWQKGIWGISAPVFSPSGALDQILCLACAVDRLEPERVEEVAAALLQTTAALCGS